MQSLFAHVVFSFYNKSVESVSSGKAICVVSNRRAECGKDDFFRLLFFVLIHSFHTSQMRGGQCTSPMEGSRVMAVRNQAAA